MRTNEQCRCGHRLDHKDVELKPEYGLGAWLLIMMGATGIPKRAEYRCVKCGHSFGITEDPAVLRKIR